MTSGKDALTFEGYVSNEESRKKIVRNALREGDAVFCSGDVVHWDEFGYLYFKDRRGDTFRLPSDPVSYDVLQAKCSE
uniref:AMP-dependent synthetase/ligase domain-containing protein n=1 Tax=Parascaris equorum TaxID=6256 RepID=A0A914RGR4_PAREQ